MSAAPLPPDEESRLIALFRLELLDTPVEERFDRITQMVCRVLDVPMAVFSLIDRDRQWIKSSVGLNIKEDPRHLSFCAHTILGDDLMVVPDANKDERFSDNPHVTNDPHITFYVGCPISTTDGYKIGSLCAIDNKPHGLSLFQMQFMRDMAKLVELEIKQSS